MVNITKYKFGIIAFVYLINCASIANACRQRVPQAQELSRYENVLLVTVQSSVRIKNPGWNTWQITAKKAQVVKGSSKFSLYSFTTTVSSNGCGKAKLPNVGENWVIYVDRKKRQKVMEAFPLNYVREYDHRLANLG